MVLTNMKEQIMQQSISIVEILIHPLICFQIGIEFWFVVKNVEGYKYLKKK